jgi:type VI secretion system protein ImpF
MAKGPASGQARLPLIDALQREEGTARESSQARLRRIKESVRRDLQDLLNTRQRCQGWSPGLEHLERSVFDYGVPDITGANLSSQNSRAAYLRDLEGVIRRHDPRFTSVKVEAVESPDPLDRVLRFRIEATLRVETGPEQTVFDFRLEPVSRHFE